MPHTRLQLLHRSTFWLKQDSPETFLGIRTGVGTIVTVEPLEWSGALADRALTDPERSQLSPLGPFL